MTNVRLFDRPAFTVTGIKTWIAGVEDDQAFGRFWSHCQANGVLKQLNVLRGDQPGHVTHGMTLGISRVEADSSKRAFFYMIAVEILPGSSAGDLEIYQMPAARWAAFDCQGKVPDSIVAAEMFAFTQWLPGSGYAHANAPEMEVYLPPLSSADQEEVCEFWLPIRCT